MTEEKNLLENMGQEEALQQEEAEIMQPQDEEMAQPKDEPLTEEASQEPEQTPEPFIEDVGQEQISEEKDQTPGKNLWDDPDFPKTGWVCVGMTDYGSEHIVCELCGQQNVRYAHHMRHPEYGDLTVGCICAGKMEGDIERAKRRERDFKRKKPEEPRAPYHETYYLRYGEGKRTTPQDIDGTKAFLQLLGFDGGELRQARKGKPLDENIITNGGKTSPMRCSYCGAGISGVDFYKLPDGRLRCTNCSSTVVKSKTEIDEICKRVMDNMENFFGATVEVPVNIEVVDERKLKRKIGASIGTKDDQSLLILGAAVNKRKNYSIILENGAPRISLIATFAHELTHIWQYTHWDNKKGFKKCPKSKRLIIYEGMAKWAEIQYLYLVGEINAAAREELITKNRLDEYGVGFNLYEDRYPVIREAMTCEDPPFTPDKYPFED